MCVRRAWCVVYLENRRSCAIFMPSGDRPLNYRRNGCTSVFVRDLWPLFISLSAQLYVLYIIQQKWFLVKHSAFGFLCVGCSCLFLVDYFYKSDLFPHAELIDRLIKASGNVKLTFWRGINYFPFVLICCASCRMGR